MQNMLNISVSCCSDNVIISIVFIVTLQKSSDVTAALAQVWTSGVKVIQLNSPMRRLEQLLLIRNGLYQMENLCTARS